MHIVNLSFASDVLLFTRGDTKSLELVMKVFYDFSRSTGLTVNPTKSKAYYGGVEDSIKTKIQDLTSFAEGPIPFRYLEVPLTSKKKYIQQCMILVDKIVLRIRHWRLLSFVGRLQLIRSVIFAITNY